MLFDVSTFGTIAVMMLLAIRVTRNDKHPRIAAFLWTCTITALVWFMLVCSCDSLDENLSGV
jgi:hypothetical protein